MKKMLNRPTNPTLCQFRNHLDMEEPTPAVPTYAAVPKGEAAVWDRAAPIWASNDLRDA